MLKRRILTLILMCVFLSAHADAIAQEVKVGGYLFPPFVQMHGQEISGLTLDLIELFNQQQSQFQFNFVPTSPNRRYRDFKRGMYDVIFFESPQWGWQDTPIQTSDVFLKGGEVFFAVNRENRTQAYFDHLKDKRIVAILGYHYSFLNNETNSKTLKQHYDIKLMNSPKTVINQVINDKADIGIATYSYLQGQMKHNPLVKDKIIIGDTFDQTYEHRVLIRKGHPLTPKYMNALLTQLKNNGAMTQLLDKYGLSQLN
jgi:polar amino acid transport system substrate-binding protein